MLTCFLITVSSQEFSEFFSYQETFDIVHPKWHVGRQILLDAFPTDGPSCWKDAPYFARKDFVTVQLEKLEYASLSTRCEAAHVLLHVMFGAGVGARGGVSPLSPGHTRHNMCGGRSHQQQEVGTAVAQLRAVIAGAALLRDCGAVPVVMQCLSSARPAP